jgi:hypothetical protein
VKRLIPKLLLLAVISVIPLLLYNIIMDPYGVLRKDYRHMWVCPNERVVKTDYILSNPGKYDSLLFGSSRVSQIPISVLDRETGDHWYNMTFVSGVVAENLNILKVFLRHGVRIKSMMIGLDYFSFQMLPLSNSMRTILYPDTLKDRIKFYYSFLTTEPDSSMFYEVRFDGKNASYDLLGTGEYDFIKKEENLRQHPEEHDARFKAPLVSVCNKRIPQTLAEIREIIDICRKNNIALTFFINPAHVQSYLCDEIGFQNEVRKELAQLTDFWDFSRPGRITMDNFNYYDIIHFRKKIGGMMIERMVNPGKKELADFGTLVTKKNVDAYLAGAVSEYKTLKKKLKPPCLPCTKV